MKKIYQILNNTITFYDTKGAEVSGDADDCRFSGGVWNGTSCTLKKPQQVTHSNNRTVKGVSNELTHSCHNNTVLGNSHSVTEANNTTSLGQHTSITRQGEFAHAYTGSKARTQKSVLMFEGRTVTTLDATELYLGGVSGDRFTVDESFNRSTIALDIHATTKQLNSTQAVCGYMHSKACFQSTAGVLAIQGSHTSLFATSGMSTSNVVVTAVSGTPDYIKVHVVGDRTLTMDWSVVINVYELRTNAV